MKKRQIKFYGQNQHRYLATTDKQGDVIDQDDDEENVAKTAL